MMKIKGLKSNNWLYGFCFLIVCGILSSCQKEKDTISIRNNSNGSLINKAVIIHRSDLNIDQEQYILLNRDGENIPIQFDDLNQDGIWDEVVFLMDFEPNETVNLDISKVQGEQVPDYPAKANVYLGYSSERNNQFKSVNVNIRPKDHIAQSTPYLYQYEGPAWENELVGFRIYFDSRNGKDIFGKTQAKLNAESIGLGEDYHSLQDWGMDILKVGSSLGAGSLALLKNDSLYRLTKTRDQKFEIISDGPLRGIFRLTYSGWNVDGKMYNLEETISIWSESRWYESQVRLKGSNKTDTLITGIVDLTNAEKVEKAVNNGQVLYLHGKSSENNDYLGMGIFVPGQYFAGFDDAPTEGDGITNTSLVQLTQSQDIYKFIFFVGWEGENPQFQDKQYFERQFINEAETLNQEVEIKFNNSNE